MADWIDACGIEDVEQEDLIRFDHDDRTFAIYRSASDDRDSLGDRLLDRVETDARAIGATRIFALTTQAHEWFTERGFADGGQDDLPPEYDYDEERGSRVVVKPLN